MAKRLSIKTVTAGDIKRRHPRYLTCGTDQQYAQLANDIYELMHGELGFMEEREIHHNVRRDAGVCTYTLCRPPECPCSLSLALQYR